MIANTTFLSDKQQTIEYEYMMHIIMVKVKQTKKQKTTHYILKTCIIIPTLNSLMFNIWKLSVMFLVLCILYYVYTLLNITFCFLK